MPKVPVALTIEPKLGGCAEEARQAQGSVGRDPPLLVDDLVDAGERHTDSSSQLGLRHAERLEKLLAEQLAGVGWRAILG